MIIRVCEESEEQMSKEEIVQSDFMDCIRNMSKPVATAGEMRARYGYRRAMTIFQNFHCYTPSCYWSKSRGEWVEGWA